MRRLVAIHWLVYLASVFSLLRRNGAKRSDRNV